MSEIELHIHTEDDQVHRVDAPSDLRVEELLKELVELFNLPTALPWSLYVKSSGRTLNGNGTLQDASVVEGEDLFLSSRQEKPNNQIPCKHCGAGTDPGAKFCRACGKPISETPVKPEIQPENRSRKTKPDIQLHVFAPTGQKHSVDVTADMSAHDFILALISDLALDLKNADDQEIQWGLYDKEASKMLDPAKSLAANGLTSGRNLYIHAIEVPVVKIEVYLPNGDRHSKKVPAATPTREFISSLEKEFNLHGKVKLDDKDTAKSLDPSKTLAENGVLSGHHLYVQITVRPPFPPIPWKWIAVGAAVVVVALLSYAVIEAFQNRALQLDPTKVSLSSGQTQQFRATGGGSNAPLTWSLTPEIGSISEKGLYTAPKTIRTPETVRINAETQTSPAKSASVEVSLTRDNIVSPLAVSPDSVTLGAGGTQKFGATVDGQDDPGAVWSLDPQAGEIAADGTYTAPHSIPAEQVVTVRATGGQNSAATGSATIALKPLTVSVKGARPSLFSSERLNLHATVTESSDTSVRWTVAGPGYISPSGVYFAPAQVPVERTIVITATSTVDPTKFANVQVVLKPTVLVSVSPPSAELAASGRQQFSVDITGSPNRSVKWSLIGPGTLSEDGLYIAPASLPSIQNVQITATSQAQPNKFATATISLVPLTVSIAPANVELRASESQAFRATIKGGEARVVWRLSGPGRISSSGLYTAPPNLKTDETAQVSVSISSDPGKRATATVNLLGYHGATKGTLTWSGQIPRNATFTIIGNTASVGALEGQVLPRVPVQIELKNKDFAIVEAPSQANNFDRLTIRSEKGKKANLKIEWSVQ